MICCGKGYLFLLWLTSVFTHCDWVVLKHSGHSLPSRIFVPRCHRVPCPRLIGYFSTLTQVSKKMPIISRVNFGDLPWNKVVLPKSFPLLPSKTLIWKCWYKMYHSLDIPIYSKCSTYPTFSTSDCWSAKCGDQIRRLLGWWHLAGKCENRQQLSQILANTLQSYWESMAKARCCFSPFFQEGDIGCRLRRAGIQSVQMDGYFLKICHGRWWSCLGWFLFHDPIVFWDVLFLWCGSLFKQKMSWGIFQNWSLSWKMASVCISCFFRMERKSFQEVFCDLGFGQHSQLFFDTI